MFKIVRNQVIAALVALAMACGPIAAATDVDNSTSAVRPLILRYTAERRILSRVYHTPLSASDEESVTSSARWWGSLGDA
ncbi:MAG: hypothetical protein WB795_00815 [Candidatus Acidiferrales bacterium]